jgi:hypothetical protein
MEVMIMNNFDLMENIDLKVEWRHERSGKRYAQKMRIYFDIKGETLMENLENRRCRPYNEYKKLLPQVIKELQNQGLNITGNEKIYWSQKAGCSCGCSPGFVLEGGWNKIVWVTLSIKNETKEETQIITGEQISLFDGEAV